MPSELPTRKTSPDLQGCFRFLAIGDGPCFRRVQGAARLAAPTELLVKPVGLDVAFDGAGDQVADGAAFFDALPEVAARNVDLWHGDRFVPKRGGRLAGKRVLRAVGDEESGEFGDGMGGVPVAKVVDSVRAENQQ